MPLKPKEILEGYERSKSRQQNWEAIWQDAYRYCLPHRNVLDDTTRGADRMGVVFDDTGMDGVEAFANFIVNDFFPPMQDHVEFEPGSYFNEGQPGEADREAAVQTLKTFSDEYRIAIETSNFSTAIDEWAKELAIGTANMLIQKGTDLNPLNFIALPTPHVVLERGPWNEVGGHYQMHKCPLSVVEDTWPDASLPKELADQAKADPDADGEFISKTYWDKKAKLWRYDVIDRGSEKSILKKPREYKRRSPWVTARWSIAPFEVIGRGPAIFALPSVKTANKVVEFTLKNASFAIAGVWTAVDDGVLNPNNVKMIPGALIPVARNSGHPQGASLARLDPPGNFDVSQIVLADLRQSINKAFFNEDLPPIDDPNRTATEFVMRGAATARRQSGSFGRVFDEAVQPIAYRSLDILDEARRITIPRGWELTPRYIKVRMVAPFAQKLQLPEVQAAMNWFQVGSTFGPEVFMAGAKVEEIPEWLRVRMGVDRELSREEEGKILIQTLMLRALSAAAGGDQGQAAQTGAAAVAAGSGATQEDVDAEGLPEDAAGTGSLLTGLPEDELVDEEAEA